MCTVKNGAFFCLRTWLVLKSVFCKYSSDVYLVIISLQFLYLRYCKRYYIIMLINRDTLWKFIKNLYHHLLVVIIIYIHSVRIIMFEYKKKRDHCLWLYTVADLIVKLQRNFCQMLRSNHMCWMYVPSEAGPSITDRYSHCACYFNQSMYIFGGCTSTNTTFNDLWRFDLGTRHWVRPLAMGKLIPDIFH